jgi:hypothetical protein
LPPGDDIRRVCLDERQAIAKQGEHIDGHSVVGHLAQARGRDRDGLVAEPVRSGRAESRTAISGR